MRVVVTGASSGLGEALAIEYARRHPGATIALIARRAAALEALEARLPGATVVRYPVDVTDRAALAAAGRDFLGRFGAPDVVIANAGANAPTYTGVPGDGENFERILRTNVAGTFDTFAPFVDAMRARRSGALVGIASVAGIRGMPSLGGYCASKAAVIAYLESLRLELRDSGVRVVTIAPGYVRTPMTAPNRYPMPFLMDADAFAARAADAIERGARFAVIPWQMGWVARVLRVLPRALFDAAFARAPHKPRAGAPPRAPGS
ncbi:MAG TPA: SDR family oxidoreductase [Burkholderiaceae bacterium]|nr:SDR family oxidoreductase [Burkholderiaceae bacterium]